MTQCRFGKYIPKFFIPVAFILACTSSSPAQQVQLASKKVLTLGIVKEIANASSAFALSNNWHVVIAIVDEGGHLLYLERMDGVQTGSVEVAIQKAKTAASFKRPSRAFEEGLISGRIALVALPGAIPLEGGVPITWDDQILGAVGVSGVTAQQDGLIAQAGADALKGILGN